MQLTRPMATRQTAQMTAAMTPRTALAWEKLNGLGNDGVPLIICTLILCSPMF